jgi:PAS domain S-box-containing protein
MSDVDDAVESLPSGLAALSDPVFLFDRTGTLLDANAAAQSLCGPKEAVGRSAPDLFDSGSEALCNAIDQTPEQTVSVTLRGGEGTACHLELSLSSLPEQGGCVVGVGRERSSRAPELEKRERALRRAYEIITTAEAPSDSTIDALLQVVRETLGTEFATLSRITDGEYHIEGLVGPDGASTVQLPNGETIGEGDTLPVETTNCEQVVASEQTLSFGHVERDAPELADRPVNADIGITAYVGAPVVVDDDTYGTFCFYDREGRTDGFSEWEVTFVELLSSWVSNQLEREELMEQRRDRQLQSLLEYSSDRLSVLDEDWNYTFVSSAAEVLTGHATDELLGSSGLEYVHPDDRGAVEATLEELLDNPDETYTFEYRIRTADDEFRWVEARGTNKLQDPAIEGVVVNARDITDRKQREQQLKEEQAFTESIFEALPDVLYAFDEDGTFLRWNGQLSTVTGYDDEEIASMHPTDFIAEDDQDAVVEAISTVFVNEEPITVEADFVTSDGERIPYEFTGARMSDESGEALGLVGIGRDISERKERQRRFEAVFNNTYQFTGLMDPDGTLLEANRTALEFGGLDRTDVIGTKLWDVYWFQSTEQAREVAKEAVETAQSGNFYRKEVTVQGEAGTEVIDFSVRPVFDDDGEVSLLIPEGRQITALKRRERHLGVLHRFLRHNLRNKMTVINGTASLLGDELADTDLDEHVTQIEGAADELLELSETANELSRTVIDAETDPGPVDLGDVLHRVVSSYPDATIDVPDTEQTVVADWRLDNVFEQLVENALEHTGPETTVEITVDSRPEFVAVSVIDDGPGVPETELTGIVNEEQQTQLTHGSGFGLWLVRSVLDEYGGNLAYEPAPGGGSVFTVELPAVSA